MQNQWKFGSCQAGGGKSNNPYLLRSTWRKWTDLTTDPKPNISLKQNLGTFLTQFQAKMLTGLSWIPQSVNHSECIFVSAPLGMFSLLFSPSVMFLASELRLNRGETVPNHCGCSDWLLCLVRAPKVCKTLSAEEGGYVNMRLHTCNNMTFPFHTHGWTPGSCGVLQSAFICLHSLIWLSVCLLAASRQHVHSY